MENNVITLNEMIERENTSEELLNKIRFFVTSQNINPFEYRISPDTGVFYNINTSEELEVTRNPETGKYEIINHNERTEQPLNLNQSKVRTRTLPKDINNQAAFAKISILTIICISISLLLSMLILLIK